MSSIPLPTTKFEKKDDALVAEPIEAPGVFDAATPNEEDQNRTNLYTALVAQMKLDDEHREELRAKRGFTDEVIEGLKFRSCGEYCRSLIEGLRKEFGTELLLRAGLLAEKDGATFPATQLTTRNILIPFLSAGAVYFVRPHKFGLKEQGVEPYLPHSKLEGTVVIAESEFKAVAAALYGYGAVGVPGISTFNGKHLPRLVKKLTSSGKVSKVVIVFDNELKGDPKLKNFKKDALVRWDTQYRAVQLAYLLYRELNGTPVLIGTLPADWMVEGKIDIDGARAIGKTADDFKKVVETALVPNKYIETLPEIGQKVVRYYLNRFFLNSPVERNKDCYVIKRRSKDGEDYDDKVSNFVFDITATFETEVDGEETLVRNVTFLPRRTSSKVTYCFQKKHSELREFRRFVVGCGNYVFDGSQEDLNEILKYEFAHAEPRVIHEAWGVGLHEHEEEPLWLFRNCGITGAGRIIEEDEGHVVWRDLEGYRLLPLSKRGSRESLPGFDLKLTRISCSSGCLPFAEAFLETHKLDQVKLALGCVLASLISDKIYERFRQFPLLFVHGKRESGKNTLMRWLMALLGFDGDWKPDHVHGSAAAIQRSLEYYKSLLYVIDEYRNSPRIQEAWDSRFRGVHDRTAPQKATKERQTRGDAINATLAILGEETPEDNALLSRCILVRLEGGAHGTKEACAHMEKLYTSRELGRVGLYVLTNRNRLVAQVLGTAEGLRQTMISNGVSARVATNYAIAGAMYSEVFLYHDTQALKAFSQWLRAEAATQDRAKNASHPERAFFDDLPGLKDKLRGFWTVIPFEGKTCAAIHWKTFYNVWRESESRRRQGEVFSSKTLCDLIEGSGIVLKKDHTTKISSTVFDGGPCVVQHAYSCMLLNLDDDKTPEGLKSLVSEQAPY